MSCTEELSLSSGWVPGSCFHCCYNSDSPPIGKQIVYPAASKSATTSRDDETADAEFAHRARQLLAADPFAKSLGIELVSAHTDRVELVMPTAKAKTNFLEVIHGGVLFSLADVVLSLLSNACGTTAQAISTQLTLYRPTRAGLPLSAIGVPV